MKNKEKSSKRKAQPRRKKVVHLPGSYSSIAAGDQNTLGAGEQNVLGVVPNPEARRRYNEDLVVVLRNTINDYIKQSSQQEMELDTLAKELEEKNITIVSLTESYEKITKAWLSLSKVRMEERRALYAYEQALCAIISAERPKTGDFWVSFADSLQDIAMQALMKNTP